MTPEELRQKVLAARAEVARVEAMFLVSLGWESTNAIDGRPRWRDSSERTWMPQGVAVAIAMAALDDA